jgi:hypothetical protein
MTQTFYLYARLTCLFIYEIATFSPPYNFDISSSTVNGVTLSKHKEPWEYKIIINGLYAMVSLFNLDYPRTIFNQECIPVAICGTVTYLVNLSQIKLFLEIGNRYLLPSSCLVFLISLNKVK